MSLVIRLVLVLFGHIVCELTVFLLFRRPNAQVQGELVRGGVPIHDPIHFVILMAPIHIRSILANWYHRTVAHGIAVVKLVFANCGLPRLLATYISIRMLKREEHMSCRHRWQGIP